MEEIDEAKQREKALVGEYDEWRLEALKQLRLANICKGSQEELAESNAQQSMTSQAQTTHATVQQTTSNGPNVEPAEIKRFRNELDMEAFGVASSI